MPSGSVTAAMVGPPGTSKGSITTVAPSSAARCQGGADVAHLDVAAHTGGVALADVACRPRLGTTHTGRDVHDRAVADVPVEEVTVEGTLEVGVAGLDLPVHDGPGPVRASSSKADTSGCR